jgi:hypothetical protein
MNRRSPDVSEPVLKLAERDQPAGGIAKVRWARVGGAPNIPVGEMAKSTGASINASGEVAALHSAFVDPQNKLSFHRLGESPTLKLSLSAPL